jgi:hypothetical protein
MMEGNEGASQDRKAVMDLINHGISKTENSNKITSAAKRKIDDDGIRIQFDTYSDMKRRHPESSIKIYQKEVENIDNKHKEAYSFLAPSGPKRFDHDCVHKNTINA